MRGWFHREALAASRVTDDRRQWARVALRLWTPWAGFATLLVLLHEVTSWSLALSLVVGGPLVLLATGGLPWGPRGTLTAAAFLWCMLVGGTAWSLGRTGPGLWLPALSPVLLVVASWPRLLRVLVLGPRAKGWNLPPEALLREQPCPAHLQRLAREALVPRQDPEEAPVAVLGMPEAPTDRTGRPLSRLHQRARALRAHALARAAETSVGMPRAAGASPLEQAEAAGDHVLRCRILAATAPWQLAHEVTERPGCVAEALAWELPGLEDAWGLPPVLPRPIPGRIVRLPVAGGVTALQRGMPGHLPYLGTAFGQFLVLSRTPEWKLVSLGHDEARVPIVSIDADPKNVRMAYGRKDGVVALVRVEGEKVVGDGREVDADPIADIRFVPGRPWLAALADRGWLQVMSLDGPRLPVLYRQQPAPALSRMDWRLRDEGVAVWLIGPGYLRWVRPEQDRTPAAGEFPDHWVALAIEPDRGWWVLGDDGEIRGYAATGGEPSWRLQGRGRPRDAAFGRRGAWLASVWTSGEVRVHDLAAGGSLLACHRLEGLTGPVALLEDGGIVAVGTEEGLVLLPVHPIRDLSAG